MENETRKDVTLGGLITGDVILKALRSIQGLTYICTTIRFKILNILDEMGVDALYDLEGDDIPLLIPELLDFKPDDLDDDTARKEGWFGLPDAENTAQRMEIIKELVRIYEYRYAIYHVRRVFKNGDPARVVDEYLTRTEAMEMVQEDIDDNPNAEYYMLVFDKM